MNIFWYTFSTVGMRLFKKYIDSYPFGKNIDNSHQLKCRQLDNNQVIITYSENVYDIRSENHESEQKYKTFRVSRYR